jgi:hypothetical protein
VAVGNWIGKGFSFAFWYGWKETVPGIGQRFFL